MRAARPVVTLVLALGLAGGVSGCETIQQVNDTANNVSQGVDKVKLCAEAIKLVGFSPDMSDPQKALEETQAKAEELNKLAAQAGDASIKSAFESAANGMSSVNSASDWVKQKADLVAKVTEACGG